MVFVYVYIWARATVAVKLLPVSYLIWRKSKIWNPQGGPDILILIGHFLQDEFCLSQTPPLWWKRQPPPLPQVVDYYSGNSSQQAVCHISLGILFCSIKQSPEAAISYLGTHNLGGSLWNCFPAGNWHRSEYRFKAVFTVCPIGQTLCLEGSFLQGHSPVGWRPFRSALGNFRRRRSSRRNRHAAIRKFKNPRGHSMNINVQCSTWAYLCTLKYNYFYSIVNPDNLHI